MAGDGGAEGVGYGTARVAGRGGGRGPRVRERLFVEGVDVLSDEELLALVLGTGGPGVPVRVLAQRVLSAFGSCRSLLRADLADLIGVPGLGPAKACRLKAALELGRRGVVRRPVLGQALTGPEEVAGWFAATIGPAERESFWVVALDVRNRVVRAARIAEGHAEGVEVQPREVFRVLVRAGASRAILVHNHPSGDPSPSPEDWALTERLKAGGQMLGIRILDHLVLAGARYWSMASDPGWD